MIYCPYTDCEIPVEQASSEHIIPLALGGTDGLELLVDAAANAHWGSLLDGKFASELVTALRRTKFDTRGQSSKEPKAIIKHASYGEDDRPAQVSFHSKHGMKVWDSRDRAFRERVPTVKLV